MTYKELQQLVGKAAPLIEKDEPVEENIITCVDSENNIFYFDGYEIRNGVLYLVLTPED